MRLRLRTPAGQKTLSLPEDAIIQSLQREIAEKTGLDKYDVKYGYPPRPLDLEKYPSGTKLSDMGIQLDGEQLIVSRRPIAPSLPSPKKVEEPAENVTVPQDLTQSKSQVTAPGTFSFADVGEAPSAPMHPPNSGASKSLSLTGKQNVVSSLDSPEIPIPSHGGTMVLRIMPDDNSCLFRAFNTAFFGTSMDNMHELRSIIAQYIQSHPETYSEAVLDQKVDDYCRWIQTEDAWGGSIELDILSKQFDIEICSVDVQTLRVDQYNEGKPQRCILVYSGIHYDTIALSPSDAPHTQAYAPPDFDTKVFDAFDDIILSSAVDLCSILQQRHYYTDTGGFKVRCNLCGVIFKGEKGATQHAAETGHMDFGEAS